VTDQFNMSSVAKDKRSQNDQHQNSSWFSSQQRCIISPTNKLACLEKLSEGIN